MTSRKPGRRPRTTEPRDDRDRLVELAGDMGMASTPARRAQLEGFFDIYLPRLDPNDPKARKRKRILDAATQLFVRNGYRKTSLDDVARSANVAKGTVYLYFKNKAELLVAAVADEKAAHGRRFAELFGSGLAGRELVRKTLYAAFIGLQEMPLTLRLLGGDREVLIALEEMQSSMPVASMAMQQEGIVALLSKALGVNGRSQDVKDAAQVMVSLMYSAGALFDPRVRGGMPLERFAAVLSDVLVEGVIGAVKKDKS